MTLINSFQPQRNMERTDFILLFLISVICVHQW
jgi:hypothetical protein